MREIDMLRFGRLQGAVALIAASVLPATAGGTTVEKAWARATPAGVTIGALYGEIRGETADRLISVSTPAAGKVEVHSSFEENGIMKMRRVEALDIPAGEVRKLAPGGLHIMLFDIKAPLVAGATLPVTFTFEQAGAVTVEATVAPLGASAPPTK
jgi:copper(I)-binding protein